MQGFKSGPEVIHYDDRGPREDFAIVFLNSLGTDFRVWDKLLGVLGDHLRTVRIDKRGHGLSTNYKNEISIESFQWKFHFYSSLIIHDLVYLF